MIGYHITRTRSLPNIMKFGIRASGNGLDGPGVYLWDGPLENALKNAFNSLEDNHYDMSDDSFMEFIKELEVIEVTIPDEELPEDEITIHYENEYFVKRHYVRFDKIKHIGNFYDLYTNMKG